MGLYELVMLRGFPGLIFIIMIEIFQSRRKYENLNMEL